MHRDARTFTQGTTGKPESHQQRGGPARPATRRLREIPGKNEQQATRYLSTCDARFVYGNGAEFVLPPAYSRSPSFAIHASRVRVTDPVVHQIGAGT